MFTTSDAAKFNITRAALSRAVEKGHLEKLQRGLYGYVGREESEMQSYAEVSARAKNSVIFEKIVAVKIEKKLFSSFP